MKVKHRRNLEKLANHLAKMRPGNHFDMGQFCEDKDWLRANSRITCGSVGCACGYGPTVGIKKKSTEDWDEYADRCFLGEYDYETPDKFEWCFGQGWQCHDNTPKGAAKRIRYMLKNGVPEGFEWPAKHFVKLYENIKYKNEFPVK